MSKKKVRLMGVPRCGTNYLKYVIERSSNIECGFNVGWWKHAVVPPLMNGNDFSESKIDSIILFKEPVSQIISFYKFAQRAGTGLTGSIDSIESFIHNPIEVTVGNKYTYYYDSPLSYWLQFYKAAERWQASRTFVDFDEFKANPEAAMVKLAKKLGQKSHFDKSDPRLEMYMGQNADVPVDNKWQFNNETTLEIENKRNENLLNVISDESKALILNNKVATLYEKMQNMSVV